MRGEPGPDEPVVFAARLRPYRSLSRTGFSLVIGLVAIMSFTTGLVFWLRGAWPVVAFAGLDVVVIWAAFRANFRSARVYEDIRLTPHDLMLRRVGLDGAEDVWHVNPHWARLAIDRNEEGLVTALTVAYAGQRRSLGGFLGPDERTHFTAALASALSDVKARTFQVSLTPA